MSHHLGWMRLIGILCVISTPAWAQDELIANPYFTYWSSFKPGTTAMHVEKTKLAGAEGELVPDGMEEKHISYKLIEVGTDRVVVEMVVTEREFLGYVQAAPTRYIYPAKIKKSHIDRFVEETGGKMADEVVKFDGKDMKCRTIEGSKSVDGNQVEYKAWLSSDVPGGVIKKVRTAKQGGNLVAETTTTLESFKKAE